MSLLSKVISNLFNGVSQQPAELRDPSQAAVQVNAISSPSYGLKKRPGTTHIGKIGFATQEPLVHFVNRDKNEQYAVSVTDGDIRVFDVNTGSEVKVSTPDGIDYISGINPQEDLRLVSVADYTFVLNTKRPVQLNAGLVDSTDHLEATVSFPTPLINTPVKEPGSSTNTPSSGGTYGDWGLPTYSDPSAGGTPSSPNLTNKPKDPSNPDKPASDTPPATTTPTDPNKDKVATPTSPSDSGWPTANISQYYSFKLPNAWYPFHPLVQRVDSLSMELDLLNNLWDNKDKYLVAYIPAKTYTFIGSSGGSDLSRFVTGNYTVTDPAAILTMVRLGLIDEGYTVVDNYTTINGTTVFPYLCVKDVTTSNEGFEALNIARSPMATYVSRTMAGEHTVLNALGFDAVYVFVTTKEGEPDVTYHELPVRISFMGCAFNNIDATNDGNMNMLAGVPDDYYTAGDWLFNRNTNRYDIPIIGFAPDFYQRVVSYQSPLSYLAPPNAYLTLTYGSGVSVSASKTYPGKTFTYIPPLAFRLVNKSTARKSQLGPYLRIYAAYGTDSSDGFIDVTDSVPV